MNRCFLLGALSAVLAVAATPSHASYSFCKAMGFTDGGGTQVVVFSKVFNDTKYSVGKTSTNFNDYLADLGSVQNLAGEVCFANPTRSGAQQQKDSFKRSSNFLKYRVVDVDWPPN